MKLIELFPEYHAQKYEIIDLRRQITLLEAALARNQSTNMVSGLDGILGEFNDKVLVDLPFKDDEVPEGLWLTPAPEKVG